MATTMKAIVQTKAGGPEVLHFSDVEKPQPLPHDVVVKVHALAINPVDMKQRKSYDDATGKPRILGWDASGVITELGPEVTDFKVGDEVFFAGSLIRAGTYAEFVAVDSRIISRKPKTVSHEDAAAFPLTALTAWEPLEEQLRLTEQDAGKTILVIGGAGGVGSIGIQIAKKVFKLKVVATASRPETEEFVRKLGADHVINHQKDLTEELKRIGLDGVHYILNTAEPENSFEQWANILHPLGGAVTILPVSKPVSLTPWFRKRLTLAHELMFTRPIFGIDLQRQGNILKRLADLVDKGEIVTTRTVTFDWKQIAEAHKLIESGKTIGKIVLTVSS